MRFLYKKLLRITTICLALLISLCPINSSAFNLFGPSPAQWNKYAFWYQLRDTFQLNHYADNPEVFNQIKWFYYHQHYLGRLLKKAAPYMYYVYTQVKKRHLPGELVLLPVIESAYDPFAYSDRGAAGLWQLMPGTATGYGLKQDWWYDGRRDIYASTNAALDYLTYLQSFFNGNWLYAIASYDAGEGTVQNAIQYNANHNRNTDFWNLPLPHETDAYVPRLLALAAIISEPEHFKIKLPPMQDGPYFARINVGFQIDLATAAKLAHINIRQLYKLNPGYNRWATDPNGPFWLLLPIDSIDTFKENLAKLPSRERVTWNRYRVRSGDSLNLIAERFHSHVALIQEVNKLKSNIIHPGEVLLIPKNVNTLTHYDFSPELVYANKRQLSLGPQKVLVKVNVGDSLWAIAMKYQVKPSQIRFWNHLSYNQPLQVGQKLTLWIPQHTQLPSELHASHYSLLRNYTVQAGDTLDAIAHKFNTKADTLKKLNHLKTSLLHLGQKLKIPPTDKAVFVKHKPSHIYKERIIHYTVKPGDSLYTIADHFNVKVTQLQKWNKAFLGKYLHPGQILVIYRS